MIKSVYFYFLNKKVNNWGLTIRETVAQSKDANYRLATLEDLNDWVCVTGKFFNGLLNIQEGVCKWEEHPQVDMLDPEFSLMVKEYTLVGKK